MIDQSKNAHSIFLEIVEQAPHERWAGIAGPGLWRRSAIANASPTALRCS